VSETNIPPSGLTASAHAGAPSAGLRIGRLAARRGYVTLFAGDDAAVGDGEALTVTGPNGSGKTTLLRILAGLTAPSEGEVRWRNDIVRPFDVHIRNAVVFNGHLPALKDELTTEENLAQWSALDGIPPSRAALEAALDGVALTGQRRLPVRVLSQGQRRRIGLARLRLSVRPLWVLDEPLTALDAEGVELLRDLLGAHLAAGGLCVAASHQPLPIERDRERTLVLGSAAAKRTFA
jgi:heme exporter protein A